MTGMKQYFISWQFTKKNNSSIVYGTGWKLDGGNDLEEFVKRMEAEALSQYRAAGCEDPDPCFMITALNRV